MNSTAPRKRLARKVSFRMFQDDANGEWGLTHADTFNGSEPFNAFWGDMGIFHDVFEHAHEHSKHFRGIYGMNVGGEMAAMGALWYYRDELGFYKRLPDGYRSASENMMESTLGMVTEGIEYGNIQFGDTLECGVPSQDETDNSELECILDLYAQRVRAAIPNKDGHDDTERCQRYKNSVTAEKIANLHRWGFRDAQKLVPNTWENRMVLEDFWNQLGQFCRMNRPEEIAMGYSRAECRIYRTGNLISWRFDFLPDYGSGLEKISLRSKEIS